MMSKMWRDPALKAADKKKGPGRGWWGPDKGGTHGAGKKERRVGFETRDDANQYLAGSAGLNPDLSDAEDAALEWYKGEGYFDINEEMRAGGYSTDPRADAIESAIKKGKTDHSMVVYRGIDFETFEDYDDLTGDSFADSAFVSTSLSRNIAESHSDGVLIEIHVPKGTSALNMERWETSTFQSGESEVLLGANTSFSVIKDSGVDSDPRNIVVEAVTQ